MHRSATPLRALACALLLACFGGAAAQAQPPARVGRIAWLGGEVTLRQAGDAAGSPARLNWPVTGGMALRTGPTGRAEVSVGSTLLRLDVDSDLRVEQLDDTQLQLRLMRGSLALRAATTEAVRGTRVDTALARITPLEPGMWRLDLRAAAPGAKPGERLGVQAVRGALSVATIRQQTRLASGQRLELGTADALSVDVPAFAQPQPRRIEGEADAFDNFVRQRDASFEARVSTRYVSTEMTGFEELDRHGRWVPTAELGAVWLPAVAADWAPYEAGQWAWIEPWGWTWVDDAPWGFAPFHYGRWAQWSGRWCWVPGPYEMRPSYLPASRGALMSWPRDAAAGHRPQAR